MKNTIKKILILLLIIIICHYIFKLLIVEHNFTYKIDKYSIDEHFYIKKGHHYDLVITNKKENYTYTIDKNISKKKKIIKDIKVYKSNNLKCIIPVYKKEINNNIYCNLDNNQVSNDYLLKSNNKDFEKIIKKVKIKLPSSNNHKKKYKSLFVYNKNINNNNFYIWNYKGIYVLNNNKNNYVKILNYDLYDNVMNCIVNKYYVLFENTNVNGIENIYYYDSKKNKLNKFKLKEKIDKDSYINGVVDNLIYVTDRRNKKEYTIKIIKREIKEIDDEQTSYIIYNNGIRKKVTKREFFMENQYFNNNSNYKYFIKDNKIYKKLKGTKNNILLLELNDIVEWKVINDEIIILVDDTIYYYSDETGLRKILENSELRYNYKNIYNIGE